MPSDGWLGEFLRFTSATMMAPRAYTLACGLAALSAAVGRGVWFRLGGGNKRWHPHLWIVLYGPAGWQKTTPTHAVSDLVLEARGAETLLPRRWSPEAFYDALAAMPDGFWDAGELSAFLSGARREHMGGARDDLSDLWDSPTLWKRKLRKESIEVTRPAPTAIATARPDLFADAVGTADFQSGFLSRWLLFEPPPDTEPPYVGIDTVEGISEPMTRAIWQGLIDSLKQVAAWHGGDHRCTFDVDARELHAYRDQAWQREARRGEVATELAGWALRRGIQAQKLSVLHALSRHTKPEVEGEDMAWAVAIVEACWDTASQIALDTIGLDREGTKRARVWETAAALMRRSGGTASRREIMKHVWRNVRDKRELLAMLAAWEEAGNVELGRIRAPKGPPAPGVRLLNGQPAPEGWEPQSAYEEAET
jgi:hypothetical protein